MKVMFPKTMTQTMQRQSVKPWITQRRLQLASSGRVVREDGIEIGSDIFEHKI